MAALANGRPVVSTSGPSTEPIWAESKGVALTPTGDVDALARAVDEWLADPDGRSGSGRPAAPSISVGSRWSGPSRR